MEFYKRENATTEEFINTLVLEEFSHQKQCVKFYHYYFRAPGFLTIRIIQIINVPDNLDIL